MPAQRDPGHYSVTKKKKKPATPKAPSTPSYPSAVLGGKEVKASHKAAKTPEAVYDVASSVGAGSKSQGVLTSSERRVQSYVKPTGKHTAKKERKAFHKQERLAKAFRGTLKHPRTDAERSAQSRGKAIREILYGSKSDTPANNTLQHESPDVFRLQRISDLKSEKANLESSALVKSAGVGKQKGGVATAKSAFLNAELAHTNYDIIRLKHDAAKRAIHHTTEYIHHLEKLKDKPDVRQGRLTDEIKAQKKNLAKLQEKRHQLSRQKDKHQKTSRQAQRSFSEGSQHAIEALDPGDPQDLGELGFRVRGEGDNTKLKLPGGPWFDYKAPTQSSEFEDAVNTGLWVPGVGAGARLAYTGAKAAVDLGFEGVAAADRAALKAFGSKGVAGASLKAGEELGIGLSNAKNLIGGRLAAVVPKGAFKDVGTKAVDAFLKRAPTGVKTGAANIASKAAISSGTNNIVKAVAAEGETIEAGGGTVIQRVGDVAKEFHAESANLAVADAMDEALFGTARRAAVTFGSKGGVKTAAANIGRKTAKGGIVLGATTIAPQMIQGKSFADSASLVYRDAYDALTSVVPSTYALGAAGFQYISSGFQDHDQLDAFAKGFTENDPIALAFQGKWDDALNAYNERPFSTMLELAGVEYGLGRGLGSVARSGAVGKNLQGWAQTLNETQFGSGATIATDLRSYSKDIFRKAGSVAGEKIIDSLPEGRVSGGIRGSLNRERVNQDVDISKNTYTDEALRHFQDTTKEDVAVYRDAKRLGPIELHQGEAGPNALPFIMARIMRNPTSAYGDLMRYRMRMADKLAKNPRRRGSDIRKAAMQEENIKIMDEILENKAMIEDPKIFNIARQSEEKEFNRQYELTQWTSLDKHQARASAWIPYIVHHLNGKLNQKTGLWDIDVAISRKGVRGNARKSLDLNKPNDIDAIAKWAHADDGTTEPAFVRFQSIFDDVLSNKNPVHGRALRYHHRTDAAMNEGTWDMSFNNIYAHHIRSQHAIHDAQFITKIANRHTPLRKITTGTQTEMRMGTHDEIDERIGNLPNPDDYIPVNIEAYNQKMSAMRGMGEENSLEATKFNDSLHSATRDGLDSAKDMRFKDDPSWVAVPKAVWDRLESHAKVDDYFYYDGAGQMVRRFTREFKGAVLPFNPHWALGNVMDMTFRLMMSQPGGPVQWAWNLRKGRNTLKHLKENNPQGYHEIMSQIGHGFQTQSFMDILEDRVFTASEKKDVKARYDIHNSMMSVMSHPTSYNNMIMRSLAHANGLVPWARRMSGTGYRLLQEYFPTGFKVNRAAEQLARTSEFGRQDAMLVKEIQHKMSESILMTPKVIEDTTWRLSNTNVQHALAERVNGVLGDYSRLSPSMRAAVHSYAPFALWFRASVNWVLTLPKHYPIKTAILASVNALTEPDRAALGLSELHPTEKGEKAGKSGVTPTRPSYQQGSIQVGESLFPTASLTSFGTFNQWGVTNASRFLLPQISSTLNVGNGLSWNGEELTYPDGRVLKDNFPALVGIALNNLMETYFPFTRWWKIYQADGAPDETATVFNPKPQGLRDTYISNFPHAHRYEAEPQSAFNEIFNPFKVTPIDQKGGKPISPAKFGSAAFTAGQEDRIARLKASTTGTGWADMSESDIKKLKGLVAPSANTKKLGLPKIGWAD